MSRPIHRGLWGHEGGFSTVELMVVIGIMGILLVISAPVVGTLRDGQAVNSAANQLAADMRSAHSGATNQLTKYELVFAANGLGYTAEPAEAPAPEETCPPDPETGLPGLPTRCLPEGTEVTPSVASMYFWPDGTIRDGSADGANTLSGTVTVTSEGATSPRTISFNGVTSRVEID